MKEPNWDTVVQVIKLRKRLSVLGIAATCVFFPIDVFLVFNDTEIIGAVGIVLNTAMLHLIYKWNRDSVIDIVLLDE